MMANYSSDDLLFKSQMLISKFRKQREASLLKQDNILRKSHQPRNLLIGNQYFTSDFSNKILTDCDSYVERDCDKNLLSKFNKQYYNPIPIKMRAVKPRMTNNKSSDDTVYAGNLSESDNSLWSNSTESQSPDIHQKVLVPTVERGIMTDCNRNLVDEEEVFTPVTALPSSLRTLSDRNKIPVLKEKKIIDNVSNKSKKFSSICTNHEPDHANLRRKSEIQALEVIQFNGHKNKISITDDDKNPISEENNKMEAALKLFQQEKLLENEISKQMELVGKLESELVQLTSRISREEETLIQLRTQKEEIRSSRYQIFNGLSNELQSQLTIERGAFSTQSMTERSQHSTNQRMEYCPNNSCVMDNSDMPETVFTLDSETVRNIVDKIIQKEFSNSEDNIFTRRPNIQSNTLAEVNTDTAQSDEDCVLSDVLSAKDLKISQNTIETESTNQSNYRGHPPKTPKSKSRRTRAARSVESIMRNGHCHSTSTLVSRPRSRGPFRSFSGSDKTMLNPHRKSVASNDSSSSSTDQLQ